MQLKQAAIYVNLDSSLVMKDAAKNVHFTPLPLIPEHANATSADLVLK